ncbi:MAG: Gx transporter family protein [Eubacteriales bacterium]|nr:Gx transporter family protein [Eubacteriales bacterium]
MQSPTRLSTKTLTRMALFTTIAFALSSIERMIPTPLPGVKLGLANIVCLFVLINYGYKDSMIVNASRSILSAILGGGFSALIYSLPGGIVSISIMALLIKVGKNNLSTVAISTCGSVAHIITQLSVAIIVTGSVFVLELLPIYTISSVFSGVSIGMVCYFLGFFARFLQKNP